MRQLVIPLAMAMMIAGLGHGQNHIHQLDTAYGDGATEWVNDVYSVIPTIGITDFEAAQLLIRMINNQDFNPGTTILLHGQDGEPIIQGTKDALGNGRFALLATETLQNPTQTALLESFSPAIVVLLDEVYGEGSTEWVRGVYLITPTFTMVDVLALRELSLLMNTPSIPTHTRFELRKHDGTPLVIGTKDETGNVSLRSMLPQYRSTTATPSTRSQSSPSSNSTWGIECTSYDRGNTSGVRCVDSDGHVSGHECTSYGSDNTFGMRCRDL